MARRAHRVLAFRELIEACARVEHHAEFGGESQIVLQDFNFTSLQESVFFSSKTHLHDRPVREQAVYMANAVGEIAVDDRAEVGFADLQQLFINYFQNSH